jgi:hypothetical protein
MPNKVPPQNEANAGAWDAGVVLPVIRNIYQRQNLIPTTEIV